jgi:hypothetical protein
MWNTPQHRKVMAMKRIESKPIKPTPPPVRIVWDVTPREEILSIVIPVVCVLLLLALALTARAAPPRPKIIKYGDGWVLGTLYADAIAGEISGATIADASADYTNDSIGGILHYLSEKVNSATTGSVISYPIIGDLYGFQETFATTKTEWQVLFPDNKRIKPDGTFLCFIGGMSFHASAKVLPGLGGKHRGVAVKLSDDWEWPPGTDARGVFQFEEWAGELTAPAGMIEPMTPITTANQNMHLSLTGF